jgi:hypothetical protein
MSPPIVDVRTEGGNSGSAGATSLAWNHTVGTLTNGALVGLGGLAGASNPTISTYQWDAAGTPINLTILGKVSDSLLVAEVEIWLLKAPSSGTKQVKITPSTSCQIVGGSASYSNVNQTNPWNAASPQSATGAPAAGVPQPSVTITSNSNELAIGVCIDDEQANDDILVIGGGQTSICNDHLGAGQIAVAGSDKAGASPNVSISYTGVTNTYTWAIIGGSLVGISGGFGTPLPLTKNSLLFNPILRVLKNYNAYSKDLPVIAPVLTIIQRRTLGIMNRVGSRRAK